MQRSPRRPSPNGHRPRVAGQVLTPEDVVRLPAGIGGPLPTSVIRCGRLAYKGKPILLWVIEPFPTDGAQVAHNVLTAAEFNRVAAGEAPEFHGFIVNKMLELNLHLWVIERGMQRATVQDLGRLAARAAAGQLHS